MPASVTISAPYPDTTNWCIYVLGDAITAPPEPTDLVARNETKNSIKLKWTKPTCERVVIEANNVAGPWAQGAGIFGEVYNGTGTEYNWTNLASGTRFYFQAWSFNNTGADSGYSLSYASADNRTDLNNLSVVNGWIIPVNGTTMGVDTWNASDAGHGCAVRVWDTDPGDKVNVSYAENTTGAYVIYHTQYNADFSTAAYADTWYYTNANELNKKYYWKVYIDDGDQNLSYTYHFTNPSNWGPRMNYTLQLTGTAYWPTASPQTATGTSLSFSAYCEDKNDKYVNMSIWFWAASAWERLTYDIVDNHSTPLGMGILNSGPYDIGGDGMKYYQIRLTDNITWSNYTVGFNFDANYSPPTGGGGGVITDEEEQPQTTNQSWWYQTENGDVAIGPEGTKFGDIIIPWTVTIIILGVIGVVALTEKKKRRFIIKR